MDSSAQRCAVTGATGYVGSRISEYFATRGWTVFEFARRPDPHPTLGRVHIPFQLDAPIDPAVFRDNDIRVVIHCAYDFRPVNWEEIRRINIEGSAKMLRAAKEAAVERIIFISSISAFDGCSSLYGKAKLEIEKVAVEVGALIIRSGLVYGSRSSGGMFGSLQRSVTKSAVVPLIGSGKYMQYLVHEDDLCELLLRLSCEEVKLPPAPIVAASRRGWKIRDLLQAMATAQQTRVKFLPLPWPAIWLGLKISELFGIAVPFRSDSVISLVRQNPNPDFSPGDKLGCRFREFKSCFVGALPIGLPETSHRGT
jgi:nucleoside-diphosphate-sugar epimerase